MYINDFSLTWYVKQTMWVKHILQMNRFKIKIHVSKILILTEFHR